MHTEQVRSNKPHQHPSYPLQTQYPYLLTPYFTHAHRASQVKQTTSTSIISIANTISISTYTLFHTCTQSELGQTSHINIHHIHYKHNINIYLHTIPHMHTEQVRSNKPHQHPSYPSQTQYRY